MWQDGTVQQPSIRPSSLPDEVRRSIIGCGFFPDLVSESIELALGEEAVRTHLVHHEATFMAEEVHRHLSLMVVTPTRLIVGHTDESNDNPAGLLQAITSTESVPLRNINSVTVTRVLAEPEKGAGRVVETWLTIGWGTLRRLELEPAHCADPTCEADHGFSGTQVSDDITVRMSPAADGEESVRRLVEFGSALQQAISESGR